MSSPSHVADIDSANASELDRYRVYSALEIEAILMKLAARATVVSLHITDSPWFLLTTVILADRESGVLLFEYGRNEELNMKVLDAPTVRFDTYLDSVNIRFLGQAVSTTLVGGIPAFECAFPSTLIRLQRREFFRISPPLNQPLLIKVALPQRDGKALAMHARGVDISCGGLVFLVEGNYAQMPIGSMLYETILELPNNASLKADLEVRNVRFVERAGVTGTTRIGCQFSRIDSRSMALLQRYINRLQVDRRIEA